MRYLNQYDLKKEIKRAVAVYVLVRASSDEEEYIRVSKKDATKWAEKVQHANVTFQFSCLYVGDSEQPTRAKIEPHVANS